jgi:ATP-binding cassette subfamily F protein 3
MARRLGGLERGYRTRRSDQKWAQNFRNTAREALFMGIINVFHLSLTFTGKTVFQDIGFQVEPGERVGLVGPNGSGKTTLLRLLVGEASPDKGEVRIAKGSRIGYLQQDFYEAVSGTLHQSMLNAIPDRARLRNEIRLVEEELKENPSDKVQLRLASLHQEMADLDLQFPLHRAEKILFGLGFGSDDFDRSVATLSGGWTMRMALGRILYQNPDLLLLDEPTNHLDLPTVRWLEGFLQDYRGALILICHDREFLNRQINRVFSLEPEGMRTYSGNYDSYLGAREEETKSREANARNQELKVKEAQKFIVRFRAKASKARQVQSKIKLLEKEEIVKTHQKIKKIRFSFPPAKRSGRLALSIVGVSKAYGAKDLYHDLNLTVSRGERVAVIGPNGAGKTTLLRMVAGEIRPDCGRIVAGHGVDMSYYAQHQSEMLDPTKTIIEEVYQAVPHESVGFVRNVCGAFLFSGEEVDKPVGVLSGGERARVSLAKMLVKPGNLLVMDEPTNHLDIISSEVLIEALARFDGTLLFVSHNQSFIKRLATKIWDIGPQGIAEYPGTLDEYENHLAKATFEAKESPAKGIKERREWTETTRKDALRNRKLKRRKKAENRVHVGVTLKPLQEDLIHLEHRIDELEKTARSLEKTLADPDFFKDKTRSLPALNKYGEVKKKLDELISRWEHKQEELNAAKKELGVQEN